MKKLFLEKFKCLIDNDGDNSDSPYFLLFFGWPNQDFIATVLPVYLESLDDTVAATGAWTEFRKHLAGVDEQTLALLAVLERDDGIDLKDEELDRVQKRMREAFSNLARRDHVKGEPLARRMRKEFRRAINESTNNDDLIGIRHLPIPHVGQPPHLLIQNDPDDGSYTVAFRLE